MMNDTPTSTEMMMEFTAEGKELRRERDELERKLHDLEQQRELELECKRECELKLEQERELRERERDELERKFHDLEQQRKLEQECDREYKHDLELELEYVKDLVTEFRELEIKSELRELELKREIRGFELEYDSAREREFEFRERAHELDNRVRELERELEREREKHRQNSELSSSEDQPNTSGPVVWQPGTLWIMNSGDRPMDIWQLRVGGRVVLNAVSQGVFGDITPEDRILIQQAVQSALANRALREWRTKQMENQYNTHQK